MSRGRSLGKLQREAERARKRLAKQRKREARRTGHTRASGPRQEPSQ